MRALCFYQPIFCVCVVAVAWRHIRTYGFFIREIQSKSNGVIFSEMMPGVYSDCEIDTMNFSEFY